MTTTARHSASSAAIACLLLGGGAPMPAAFAQQRVGVDSAVNPNAMGIPPGGLPRRLVLGQDVLFNERITTSAEGQTQILFVDESTLSVGPNANMVVDQFVYDPNTGAGKLAASLTRGVFRFVGGKLSKQDNAVTMRTPTATIGIRGGVMLVDLAANGGLSVIFVFGKAVTVTGLNGSSQTLIRPGFEVTVAGPGATPSAPAPAPPGATAALLAQLDGRAGAHGGAPIVPTEVTVAQSGIARAISADLVASLRAAATNRPPLRQAANVGPTVRQAQLNNQNVSIPGARVTTLAGGPPVAIAQLPSVPPGTRIPAATRPLTPLVPPVVPPFVPPTTPMTTMTYAGNFKSTNGFGATNGLLDPGGTTSNGIAYAGGALSYPTGSPQNGVFTASLGNEGQMTIPLPPGNATLPADGAGTASPAGPVTGTTYMSPDGRFFYANLTPVNAPGEREFIYGGQPVAPGLYQPTGATRVLAFNVQPDAALQSNIPFIRNAAGGNLPNAVVSPYYAAAPANVAFGDNRTNAARTATLQASLAINGQGASQQSAIVVQTGQFFTAADGGVAVTGLVRGSSRLDPTAPPVRIASSAANVIDGNGGRIYGGNAISGFVLDQNGYDFNTNYAPNQLASENVLVSPSTTSTNYAFNQPVIPTTVPAEVGAPSNRTTQTLTGFIGGFEQQRAAANGVSPPPSLVLGSASITTDATTNRVAAQLNGALLSPGDLPNPNAASNAQTQSLNFGSVSGLSAARSAFVDDSHFAAVEAAYNPAATTPASQGVPPVTVNNQILTFNGDLGQAGFLYLVSSGTVPSTALLPPGVQYCQCQYLQWGDWGGDIRGGTTDNNTLRERAHINFWVAGVPTSAADISALQAANFTGTYTGALTGAVFNNGAQYLAAGGLKATYAFGTQTGSFQVINYDGNNFTTTGKVPLSANGTYAFPIAVPVNNGAPAIAGAAQGMFYGPKAAETGGTFAFAKIAGGTSNYFTSGIFAAKR